MKSEQINFGDNDFLGIMRKYTLMVPDYQRGYDWSPEHLGELWEDLSYYRENYNTDQSFLGTIILKSSEDSSSPHEIVDGQQRLTTLYILAIAMKNEFIRRSEKIPAFSDFSRDIDTNIISVYDRLKRIQKGPKLIGSEPVRDVLKAIIKKGWNEEDYPSGKELGINGNKQAARNNLVKKAYEYNKDELAKLSDEDLNDLYNVLQEIKFVVLKVATDEKAFYLFETTNARGKDLEIGDLLKNHFFANVKGKAREEILENWEIIVDNSRNRLVQMLKHFYYVNKKHVQKKALYSALKGLAKEKGSAEKLLEAISKYSDFHNIMVAGDFLEFTQYIQARKVNVQLSNKQQDYYMSICALRLFGSEQTFPMIFAFFEKFSEFYIEGDSTLKKQPKTFLNALENFQFINYKIGENKANKIEKPFARFASDLYKTKNVKEFMIALQGIYEFLKQEINEKDEFKLKFTKLTYGLKSNETIRYIFYKIENHLNGGQDQNPKIYEPDITKNKNVKTLPVTIEHWSPNIFRIGGHVTEADFNSYEDVYNEIAQERHNIGNLMALPAKINNDLLKNKIPIKKHKVLCDQSNLYAHVNVFLDDYDSDPWDSATIKKRADEISDICYEKVFTIGNNFPSITNQQLEKY